MVPCSHQLISSNSQPKSWELCLSCADDVCTSCSLLAPAARLLRLPECLLRVLLGDVHASQPRCFPRHTPTSPAGTLSPAALPLPRGLLPPLLSIGVLGRPRAAGASPASSPLGTLRGLSSSEWKLPRQGPSCPLPIASLASSFFLLHSCSFHVPRTRHVSACPLGLLPPGTRFHTVNKCAQIFV